MPDTHSTQHDRQHDAQHQQHQQQVSHPQRLIKLISVCLKEAALDSPSFRASTNFFNSQVDHTEHWIEGLIKSLRKYPQQFNDFKEANTVLLNQLVPDFLKDGLVDQETTASLLETNKTNLCSIYVESMKLLSLNDLELVNLLQDISKVHIKHFKDIRKNFEFFQSKYDSVLLKYSSQSKSKEPSALREDAFQLFELRKSYLSSSLDLTVEMIKLHQYLDKNLLKLSKFLLKDKTIEEEYFEKIEAWSNARDSSTKSLLDDLLYSRKQIENATVLQFTPTRDLNQENVSLINPSSLLVYNKDIDGEHEEHLHEKHGWLFMKTSVGKPARTIWVRRWLFVKNGIFGMFSLSPSKNSVQETDKIGVLLSNIRYAPDEDKRFCFEIKTIDLTLIFQAENLKDLRSWLRVFSAEKQRAIENSEDSEYAFGRYPPMLREFASSLTTTVDNELTSTKVENSNNDINTTIHSTNLSELVGGDANLDFRSSSFKNEFQEPDLNTPMFTKMSKVSILARAFVSPTVIPTAVTANTWGSVNWGMYYMSDNFKRINGKRENLIKQNSLTKVTSSSSKYPAYYPNYLKKYDIQLKALFDTAIYDNELVLLQFTSLFSLNTTQELSSRCFITAKYCYFYLNSMGFVSLVKKPLNELVAVEVFHEKNWDILKVYGIEGLHMKGRIFFDDGVLIQEKMNLLINNLVSDKPKSQEEIIQIFGSMEIQSLKLKERRKSLLPPVQINPDSVSKNIDSSKSQNLAPPVKSPELPSFTNIDKILRETKSFKTNYKNDGYKLFDCVILDAPAKAVFHVLFGDHSPVFKETINLIESDEFVSSPWFTDDKTGLLKRAIDFKMGLSRKFFNLKGNTRNITNRYFQVLEEMVDAKYYRVDENRRMFKLPFSDSFRIERKIIIIENDVKTCKLLIYGKAVFPQGQTALSINRLYVKSLAAIEKQESDLLVSRVTSYIERLGSHGKVIKAIRTYGNLSKIGDNKDLESANVPKDQLDTLIVNFDLIIKFYLKMCFHYFSINLIRFLSLLFRIGYSVLKQLSVNKLLIFGLVSSIFFNFFLLGRSAVSFWTARRAEHFVKDFTHELGLNKMERSISLNDLELLSSFEFNESSSCFNKFLESKAPMIKDQDGLSVDSRFRDSRHKIAVKRNELLVELKILEKMEKELVFGSWKNFLLSEMHLCEISIDQMKITDKELQAYCDSCHSDYERFAKDLI